MENWQILEALAEKMHIALTPRGTRNIGAEIRKAVPLYGKHAAGACWGKGLLEKTFMTPNGLGRFAVFDVDVTPHSGEKNRLLFDENYFRVNIRGKLTA